MVSIRKALLCAALVGSAGSAAADEWVIGLGGSDLFDEVRAEAVAGVLSYHTDPFIERRWGSISWMATLQFDTTDNYFAGLGAFLYRPFGDSRIFFEGSLAVGGYHQGTFVGKQADDLLFKSSIGIGYRFEDESRISLTIDHLLDKKFTFDNPGKEAVFVRYTQQF